MTVIQSRPARKGRATQAGPSEHKFVRALTGSIEPVRVGFAYRVGLLLAAGTMLVLPLVYLAVVACVAYGIYWYAVNAAPSAPAGYEPVYTSRQRDSARVTALYVIFVYLGPLLVGLILLLFMIKPLFVKRGRGNAPMTVEPQDEPLLFAFVERLCEVVGAPKPSRIRVDTQVNASAGFRDGLSGFLTRDLVLTIGLPLAAGLTVRQLAGVLAHEFGHFAQGTGMRVTFVVRSINAWFYRCVYERDAWDQMLERASRGGTGHWALTLLMLVSRLFVLLTRRVLWLLMFIGHAISSFLLRQMEFDADRYETRVAGSAEFAATARRLRMLGAASHVAFDDLQAAWQEKRLGDDLSLLIAHRDASMPAEVREAVEKHSSEHKTRWHHTHPCDAARIASAIREKCPGMYDVDEPATELFADFCTLSRDVTLQFYRSELGLDLRAENLRSSSDLITSVEQQEEAHQSVVRYFQALVHPVRPVFISAVEPDVRDRDAAAELLLERRGTVVTLGAKLRKTADEFKTLDKRLANVRAARAMLSAGVRVDFAKLEIPRGDYHGLRVVEQDAATQRDAAASRLKAALEPQFERLQVALALEKADAPPTAAELELEEITDDDIPEHDDDHGAYDVADDDSAGVGGPGDAFRTAMAGLCRAADAVEQLRHNWIALAGLLPHLNPSGGNPQPLIAEILGRSRKVSRSLSDVRDALHGVAYPYEHVESGMSLARFVVKAIPEADNVGAAYHAGEMAIDAYYPLYSRILSDLCSRAEAAEQSLGLDPLPKPPKPEEKPESTSKQPPRSGDRM